MSATPVTPIEVAPAAARPRISVFGRVRRWPLGVKIGAVIVGVLALLALFAPLIAPYGPNQIDITSLLASPSSQHLFGTDDTGRDVFSRTLYALRLDLVLALAVTYVPFPIAVLAGSLAGYFGGWVDMIVSRLADIMISFPFIVLVIAIVAIVGPGVEGFLIGVPLSAWALYARLSRAEMLVVREQPYMMATTALGYTKRRAILKHGLPNVLRPCLVYTTIDLVGNLILIVVFSGYENFVSRIDTAGNPNWPIWITRIDFAGLKQKLLASIVAISAIHVLEAFLNIDASFDATKMTWLVAVHLVFVISALLLALSDRWGADHE